MSEFANAEPGVSHGRFAPRRARSAAQAGFVGSHGHARRWLPVGACLGWLLASPASLAAEAQEAG
ncbi:MAG TPA: hypothetical protein VK437_18025, partial [Steroidobacteraceae bacterium]|nr:hypothetical protein [Steroidobacteraceae bacterium]